MKKIGKRWLGPYEDGRIRLRLLQASDLPMTLHWRNQDHIRRWFFNSNPLTTEQHRAWFERYSGLNNDYVFIIEELPTGRPVGQVALYNIDWESKCAEFGRLMIGELDAAGRGLAGLATRLLLQIGFRDLGLQEAHLEVFADNTRALAIYSACGFRVAATQQNRVTMVKDR